MTNTEKHLRAQRDSSVRFFVGIDPGVNTGLAIFDRKAKKFITLETLTAVKAENYLLNMEPEQTFFVVEDARLNVRKKDHTSMPQAVGAGSIRRDSQRWEEWLSFYGFSFIMIRKRKTYDRFIKDAKAFNGLTGHEGRTSEHARVAGIMAYLHS
jgi:hypothetical protein